MEVNFLVCSHTRKYKIFKLGKPTIIRSEKLWGLTRSVGFFLPPVSLLPLHENKIFHELISYFHQIDPFPTDNYWRQAFSHVANLPIVPLANSSYVPGMVCLVPTWTGDHIIKSWAFIFFNVMWMSSCDQLERIWSSWKKITFSSENFVPKVYR